MSSDSSFYYFGAERMVRDSDSSSLNVCKELVISKIYNLDKESQVSKSTFSLVLKLSFVSHHHIVAYVCSIALGL